MFAGIQLLSSHPDSEHAAFAIGNSFKHYSAHDRNSPHTTYYIHKCQDVIVFSPFGTHRCAGAENTRGSAMIYYGTFFLGHFAGPTLA